MTGDHRTDWLFKVWSVIWKDLYCDLLLIDPMIQ